MKTAGIAFTALLFALFIAGASALPNLKVDRVEYSPASERIVARIANDSEETAENVHLAIFVDGKLYATSPTEEGFTLGPNSSLSFPASFKEDGNTHYFTALVDPYNEIQESNEQDNSKTTKLEGWEDFGEAQPRRTPGSGMTTQGATPWDLPITAASGLLLLLAIAFLALRSRGKKNA